MDTHGELIEKYLFLLLIDAVKYADLSRADWIDHALEQSHSRSCVLSSGIMLECFANNLLEMLPSGAIKNDVDKLPFLSKIDVYLLYKSKPPIDRSSTAVQRVSELKSVRDQLVHPKQKRREAKLTGSSRELTYDVDAPGRPLTNIPASPVSWNRDTAYIALSASIDFMRYILDDKLELSPTDAFRVVCSECAFGAFRASLSETELSNMHSRANNLGLDVSFLLPLELVSA